MSQKERAAVVWYDMGVTKKKEQDAIVDIRVDVRTKTKCISEMILVTLYSCFW